jgi:hypothetical protein
MLLIASQIRQNTAPLFVMRLFNQEIPLEVGIVTGIPQDRLYSYPFLLKAILGKKEEGLKRE